MADQFLVRDLVHLFLEVEVVDGLLEKGEEVVIEGEQVTLRHLFSTSPNDVDQLGQEQLLQ